MTEVLSAEDPATVNTVIDLLRGGGVVVIPTDTVYGVAASAMDPDAVARLFSVKGRSEDKPVPVLVDDLEAARQLGAFDDEAAEAARRHWPGAVTLVVPVTRRGRGLFFGGDGQTIGLRVPDDEFARSVLAEAGPLAATSANPAGEQTPATVDEIVETLDGVDVFVDGGPSKGAPSKVISFVDGERVLRG